MPQHAVTFAAFRLYTLRHTYQHPRTETERLRSHVLSVDPGFLDQAVHELLQKGTFTLRQHLILHGRCHDKGVYIIHVLVTGERFTIRGQLLVDCHHRTRAKQSPHHLLLYLRSHVTPRWQTGHVIQPCHVLHLFQQEAQSLFLPFTGHHTVSGQFVPLVYLVKIESTDISQHVDAIPEELETSLVQHIGTKLIVFILVRDPRVEIRQEVFQIFHAIGGGLHRVVAQVFLYGTGV